MIATITLELVRHGALHNQLLSPLTPYIALAGNLPAETVYVPTEHAQMLSKLRRIVYWPEPDAEDPSGSPRMFQALSDLREASQVVTRFFESFRGLSDAITEAISGQLQERARELASASRTAPDGIIRLRLIVSANELAMLPFELAQGPLSLGGSEMLSALRPPPVVITRESRRSAAHDFTFRNPEEYRVLLVAADPAHRGLPLRACMLAIYQAFPELLVDPFIGYPNPLESVRDDVTSQQDRVKVLSAATLEQVRTELATGIFDRREERYYDYTHVLILAHGRMPESIDGQPTIALHSRDATTTDFVTGDRLAATLCAAREDDATRHIKPLFVSLMVCDSGNQAQVLFAGGSIAHTLHEAGVPFVVASQFPLTFGGAVLLTQVLLSRLLKNHHPTAAIAEARHRLFTELGQTHDWASLVTYVTLPDDEIVNDEVFARKFELLSQVVDKLLFLLVRYYSGGLVPEAFLVLRNNFCNALDDLRRLFDKEHTKARQSWKAQQTQLAANVIGGNNRFFEAEQNPAYASYAAILTNACLWQARLIHGHTPFFHEGSPTGNAGNGGRSAPQPAEISEEVREVLSTALAYGHAHVFFGGRNAEIYAQITLILELLNRGSPQVVQSWWHVADWRVVQGTLEALSADTLMSLGTELLHLLISLQIAIVWPPQQLRTRVDRTCDRIIQLCQRTPGEATQRGMELANRLHLCRALWWGPTSPAMEELERIEKKLSDAGVWPRPPESSEPSANGEGPTPAAAVP